MKLDVPGSIAGFVKRVRGVTLSATPPTAEGACYSANTSSQWYGRVVLSPATVGRLATSETTLRAIAEMLARLEPDDYLRFLIGYYQECLKRYGGAWVYADLLSVLNASSRLLRPQNYLEIGVRRGRSIAAVVAATPTVDVIGFDLWTQNYAGMANPGPEFVKSEIEKLGPLGKLELVSGPSHETVPRFLGAHPKTHFDLMTVDGDHTRAGAAADLRNVIPRLKLGGVLVFDDIAHPHHPELRDVWVSKVVRNPIFHTWEFCDLGFGVGVGVRMS